MGAKQRSRMWARIPASVLEWLKGLERRWAGPDRQVSGPGHTGLLRRATAKTLPQYVGSGEGSWSERGVRGPQSLKQKANGDSYSECVQMLHLQYPT